MIIGDFNFYPIGQGCFYGGSITTTENEFTIVYDCGTVSSYSFLSQSIQKFKYNYKRIDLLMISHFDKDHVNGLKELLTNIKCEKVIIPYYEPILRLTLLNNSDSDDDYISFLKDPIFYLLNSDDFNVGEVVILENGNENNPDLRAPEPKSPTPRENLEILKLAYDSFESQEDNSFKSRVISNEGITYEAKNIRYFSLPFKISISNNFWEFVFYLKELDNQNNISIFETEINKLIALTVDQKITSLFNSSFIPIIKKLYKDHVNKNLNYTSLVVYHGPTISSYFSLIRSAILRYPIQRHNNNNCSGTLLTGDSFLKENCDFEPFFNYFSQYYIDKIFILQVPHHGSINNWNLLPNGLEDIPYYLINHGYKRKKHPHKNVIMNIISFSTYKQILMNHQFKNVNYIIKVRN